MSVTRTSRVSQTPLQTPIPYFHQWVPHGKKALVAIACKTAYVCFHRRKWVYTLGFPRKIAHNGTHAERGDVSDGALSLPSERFTRFRNPAWPGVRTANFAPFGSRSRVLPKNAESLRDSDALMRVAVPRRRSPAGLRDLFRFCRNCGFHTLCSGLSACARHGWYHYPRCALCAVEMPDGRLSKRLICRFLRLSSRH